MKVVYLLAALLAVFALVSAETQVLSPAHCGDFGVVDTFADTKCNCFSGWAPSDNKQADCDIQAPCPALKTKDAATLVGSYRPTLMTPTFSNDRYNIKIAGPIVAGRRNMTVRFMDTTNGAAEESCGYPGVLWQKSVNTLDCVDEISGFIPWSTNGMCGFTKTVSADSIMFFAFLSIHYVDTITTDDNEIYHRTSSVMYNVSVSFPTQKTILSQIVSASNDGTIKIVVIGDAVYDATTRFAQVTIHTQTKWPFAIDTSRVSMQSTPNLPITASISRDTAFNQRTTCNNVTNSNCDQQFVILINPGGACNLAGQYKFNLTLTCRDSDFCNNVPVYGAYGIRLYDNNICGSAGYQIDLSEGSLVSYADQTGSAIKNAYVPNDYVYFKFAVNSPDVTIDTLSIHRITVQQQTLAQSETLYDLDVLSGLSGVQAAGQLASLVILPAAVPAAPGTDASVWFKVQLVRAVNSFQTAAGGSSTITFRVTCDLTYHGNQKRTVTQTFTSEGTQAQGTTNLYLTNPNTQQSGALTDEGAASTVQFSIFALIVVLFASLL